MPSLLCQDYTIMVREMKTVQKVYILKPEAVSISRSILEKGDALENIIRLVCDAYGLDNFDEIYRLIIDRESRLTTGIGLEVAVPHCRVEGTKNIVLGVLLIPDGIEYNSVDGLPVKLVILLISPLSDVSGHLACLSSISHAVSNEHHRRRLLGAKNEEELFNTILETVQS